MKSIKRLTYASLLGVAGVFAGMLQAQTQVPSQWNVSPWTDGALFSSFNGAKPTWANSEALLAGQPARTDFRFWTNTVPVGDVLSFATLGITNTFSNAKIQIGMPVFIDMRCKLNPFDTTPPPIESNTVLCFYANQSSNLVVATATECKTNLSVTVNPSLYYPIMVRFAVDKFDVFFNNETETATLSLSNTTNEISKMVISGAGELDDLYISYGDPRRPAANSTGVLNDWTPSSAEEYVVANWLANKMTSGSYTKDNATKFYLTDTSPNGDTFDGELGIGSINFDPTKSNVTVAVTLKTGTSSRKNGKINGILKLKGASNYDDAKNGSWTSINAAKIGADDFTEGVATYTFTLPDANYKFFRPVIVSDIK